MTGEWTFSPDFCTLLMQDGHTISFGTRQCGPTIADMHNAALRQAVEVEREACAAIADIYQHPHIGNAIRARGQAE